MNIISWFYSLLKINRKKLSIGNVELCVFASDGKKEMSEKFKKSGGKIYL